MTTQASGQQIQEAVEDARECEDHYHGSEATLFVEWLAQADEDESDDR